jgi:peptidoglycan/LPS O-acetylase OafA/YrhL
LSISPVKLGEENQRAFLNFSRWISSFVVLVGHERHLLLADFRRTVDHGFLQSLFYFLTPPGPGAVVVFFVVSGFLVGGATWEKWRKGGVNLRAYAAARVSRIYTVLLPALIVGLVVDLVGLHYFNASGLYTDPSQYHVNISPKLRLGLDATTFLGNLALVQTILTPCLGSNGPLWSLAFEWWYYILFALIALAILGSGFIRHCAWMIAAILALALPQRLLVWGLIWIVGAISFRWSRSNKWRPHPLLGVGLFLVCSILYRTMNAGESDPNSDSISAQYAYNLLYGISYALALVSIIRIENYRLPLPDFHRKMAGFTYTTYLFHFPLMLFFVAFLYQEFGVAFSQSFSASGLAYFALLTVAIWLLCYLISQIAERHTGQVRKRLDRLLGTSQGN